MKKSDEEWDLGNLQEGCRTGSPDNSLQLSSRSHEPESLPGLAVAGGPHQQPQSPAGKEVVFLGGGEAGLPPPVMRGHV